MKYKVQRLFHGFASVRDYVIENTIKKRETLYIEYNDQTMSIPFWQLDKGLTNIEKFKSKHDNKIYSLIDYDFIPDIQQPTLFDTL